MNIINNQFDEDLKEILEVVIDKLREKYVSPFEKMVRSKNEDIVQNPSPEINLLNAFKPFMNERSRNIIDKVVSSYHVATVANSLTDDIIQAQNAKINSDSMENNSGNPGDIEVSSQNDGMSETIDYGLQLLSKKTLIFIILVIIIILLETHQYN